MSSDIYTPIGIVVSAILAVSSWIYTSYRMRKLEEFKMRFSERLKVRIEMLKSLITFKVHIEEKRYKWDKDLNNLLSTASINFQLYGESDEQTKMQKFVDFLKENEGNSNFTEEAKKKYAELLLDLVNATINSLRKELAINS